MHRVSTDADYLRGGIIIIDADGIPVDLTGTGAVRVDNTVGTRVMLGDTMIQGSTGIRDITDQLPEGSTGVVTFQRQNGACEISFRNVSIPEDITTFRFTLPNTSPTGEAFVPISADTFGSTQPQFHNMILYRQGGHRVYMTLDNQRSLRGSVQWITNDPWPTSLPGTPA